MRYLFLTLCVVCTLSAACKKQPQQPVEEYVPGMVLVGIKPYVPVDSVLALCNNMGMEVKVIFNYNFATTVSKDSTVYLYNYLNAKKYLDTFGFKAGIKVKASGTVVVSCTFQYMGPDAQQDWQATEQQLQLTDYTPSDTFRNMVVYVPVGKEQVFMEMLQKSPLVRWVELNHVYHNLF